MAPKSALPKSVKLLAALRLPIRGLRWLVPIEQHEIRKFLPTCVIFFLLTFIYDLLRPLKSALIIAEPDIGAELIPYIKVWGVLPGALLLTSITIRLSHHFSREKVFYLVGLGYIAFFSLFLLILYPLREALQLTWVSDAVGNYLPHGFYNIGKLLEKWPLVLFYSLTELWGNVLLSMLFWGFANEISTVNEARRFYPLFLLGANSAAIFAGQLGAAFSTLDYVPTLGYGTTSWEQSIFYFLCTAIGGTLAIMALFRLTHVLQPEIGRHEHQRRQESPVRLNLRQCLIEVAKNRHLALLAIIVLAYNLVFNLSDILWTNELNKLYRGDMNGYTRYTSEVTTITGMISVSISLFVTGNILRRYGWKQAALITPCAVIIFALGFFSLLVGRQQGWLTSSLLLGFLDPVQLILILGTLQMAVSRGCKYTVFDTTKEIAFIPLDHKDKRLGKAVIDGVGSRIGKSAGSAMMQLLFFVVPTLDHMIPILSMVIFGMLALWLTSTVALAKSVVLQAKTVDQAS